MEDEPVNIYWMGGLSFARHSSHADYRTKVRLAPETLAETVICVAGLRSGRLLLGHGADREAALADALGRVAPKEAQPLPGDSPKRSEAGKGSGEGGRDASSSGAPPQRQGKSEEQDHG